MKALLKITPLLFTAVFLSACGSSTTTSDNGNTGGSGSLVLKSAASDAALEAEIKASLLSSYATLNNNYHIFVTEAITSDVTAAATTSADSSASSSTNTQESGVDEADRLKTDGTYLYVSALDSPEIKLYRAEAGAAPLVKTQSLDTLNNAPLSGFYLRDTEDQLVAVAGDGTNSYPVWDMWFAPHYWQNRQTELFYLDISTPETPNQTAKLSIDGQLISSRRIGSYLYLATRHTPLPDGVIAYPQSQTDAAMNRTLINNAQLSELLPTYSINGGAKQSLFESGDCFLTDYSNTKNLQSSIISVVAVNLDAATPQPEARCFVGDAETLYVSQEALYLATTGYSYTTNNGVSTYSGSPTTEVHKFALDGTQASYKGSASVDGHLGWQQDLKPFRMSEHNDVLRIITYTGAQETSVSSPAHLYTLSENAAGDALEILGELPNANRPDPLGKVGEQIYASRFIGDKGYLVTFRMTDPLYILDLSNPADPFIASELEIDGYSDYLHPVGENYLLGIGKDAVADTVSQNVTGDGRGAWYQGVKLSLLDISNPSAPFEKETIILGGRGTETAVSRTHHALTALQSGNTLKMALPISLHETPPANSYYDSSDPRYFYNWTQDQLYRLNIDTSTGDISVLESITGETNDTGNNYYTRWEMDRSVMIGDEVYYLHKDAIKTTADISP